MAALFTSREALGGNMGFAANLKTIVVATDLLGTSEAALEYARKLASAYGARLILAHGLDPVDYAAVEGVPGRVLRRLTEDARVSLDEMASDLLREGIHSHTEVRQGAVVQMLLDVIRQYNAGLIVLGTRGQHGAGPLAVGAIAEQLVRRADCPVLAVAADWNAGEYRPLPGGPVLLAMERNEALASAVDAASALAHTFQRTLIVVHARTAAEASAFLNPCASTLEQLGIATTGDFPVRCVVKDGNPAEALTQAVDQFKPSILVIGVKRKSDSTGPHGTAFNLLASSRAPVLCVPAALASDLPEIDVKVSVEIS
ncbi:universal stress protein [Acidobacteria bacterium AB60]|nr:universal stress protein [Acidobacteria bacterium AB60]